MAHRAPISNFPLDEPILDRPGVTHKEADYSGAAKHLALPAESPERAAKGDLGLANIKAFETKPLSHPGMPFELRPGKAQK